MTGMPENPHSATARADVLGTHIDRLDMEQTLARIEELIARGEFAQHVAINAAKIVAIQDDPGMRAIVEQCELVSADGQSIVWASRLLGDALPTRVAGIDLMHELLSLAARRGLRVFILGATREVLDAASRRIHEHFPGIQLAGTRDGYFSDDESAEVAREVAAAKPHILFVAISSPKKEYWLSEYGRNLGVPFVMGVGGSVDVIAGITRRAPRALRLLGLEWAYRLAQEPGRLWRRYLITNYRFVVLLGRHLRSRRRRRRLA
jgi:N-acetylglucosaminyldiphosphoundecaprenol N-acetyl-beta-D-mannosaminyltransferase